MARGVSELCRICEKRRPRRFCPGIHGRICPLCCGEQREVTIDCPFSCEFLAQARRREPPVELRPEAMPNRDIAVSEAFLREHEPLILLSGRILFESAARVPGAIDADLREALAAMIKTYRTRESGLIYESRPANPLAAAIQQGFEQQLRTAREQMAERAGFHAVRDREVLGALVFWERLALQSDNGRRRGRAFLQLLSGFLPPPPPPAASNLIV